MARTTLAMPILSFTLSVATTFLAMGRGYQSELFNLAVDGVFLHDRVELLQLKPFGGVLAVFLRYITAGAREARGFVLGAL
jgi:hypothetical protein